MRARKIRCGHRDGDCHHGQKKRCVQRTAAQGNRLARAKWDCVATAVIRFSTCTGRPYPEARRGELTFIFARAQYWGTLGARLEQKSRPGQRRTPLADDASSRLWHRACRPDQQISTATGNVAGNGNGWVNNPQIEAAIAARYDATSLDEEETIARRLKTLAVDHVLNAPLGAMLG